MKIHEKYMRRCIELAKNGLGTTYPNPLVGSVIVYNDRIIGEGWHKKSGEPHAEVNAVNSVKDKSLLKNAILYVNLEPCSHYGKTSPCCDLIMENQIPNVVVGTVDPNVKVAGKGIKNLIESGKNVTVGILEKECNELNKRFFTFHKKKRPYIVLKWAESADGFIAPKTKEEQKPVWITNEFSRQLVHKWRSEEQAILVGTKTVIDDNPKLDVRAWTGTSPIKIVYDQKERISQESLIFDSLTKTIVLTGEEIDFSDNVAQQTADVLFEKNIQSVIIEGGRQTLQTFIDANLWDEARIFRGKLILMAGTKAPLIKTKYFEGKCVLDDSLLIFRNYD